MNFTQKEFDLINKIKELVNEEYNFSFSCDENGLAISISEKNNLTDGIEEDTEEY